MDAKSDISRSLVQIRLGGLVLVRLYKTPRFIKFYHVVADVTIGSYEPNSERNDDQKCSYSRAMLTLPSKNMFPQLSYVGQ